MIYLADTGSLLVRAYTGRAQLPLKDVAVMITDSRGDAIAFQLTDRSGKTAPIEISVPNKAAGETPDTGIVPYSLVNITARLENFEQIQANGIQLFPNTLTEQEFEMIPLSELPEAWTKSEQFHTPPQNL